MDVDGAFRGRVREMWTMERGSCQNIVGYPLSPPSVLGHNSLLSNYCELFKDSAFTGNKQSKKQSFTLKFVPCSPYTFLMHLLFTDCAGCGRDIKNGQALLALDRQWHLGCFKCKACSKVLTGEYISK